MWRWLLVWLACCAPAVYPTPPSVVLAVDMRGLSPAQADVVLQAEESWTRQTNGCIAFAESATGMKIVPLLPYDKYDTDSAFIMGMANPTYIELNYARFASIDQAVVVAAHEIGHAIGMAHTVGPRNLMSANIGHSRLALSRLDRLELARKTGCN